MKKSNSVNDSKKCLVSVIVPVFKVEQYLDRCVKSILNQTFADFEVVLIDDGSPDGCPQMCDKYAKSDSRIKVLHKQNQGLMQAWIDGVNASTGEFIAFVDSDDWIEPNFLELLVKAQKENSADLVLCNYFRSTETKKKKMPAIKGYEQGLLTDDVLQNYKNGNLDKIPNYRWNKLFKKESVLKNLKYCDPRINLWEDVCLSVACILDAKSIYILNEHIYNYYNNPKSMVNSYKSTMLKNFEYFYPKFIEVLSDKNYATEKNITEYLTRMLYIVSKNIVLSDAKQKRKLFAELYQTWLAKELFKYDLKNLMGANKYFVKLFKTKSYGLVSIMIKLWSKIKNS